VPSILLVSAVLVVGGGLALAYKEKLEAAAGVQPSCMQQLARPRVSSAAQHEMASLPLLSTEQNKCLNTCFCTSNPARVKPRTSNSVDRRNIHSATGPELNHQDVQQSASLTYGMSKGF